MQGSGDHTAFQSIGDGEGVVAWRIENLEPALVKEADVGSFFSGDSYLVLHTKKTFSRLSRDLYFWLGSDSSQDERGAAAYLAVELDDALKGRCVQHREVQGHESSHFLSVFKDTGGVKYLDGGIDSAFTHVEADQYKPRLLHVKGTRNVRVNQVELVAASLNDGDSFILDLGLKLFLWNGAKANKYEKFKALELMQSIKNTERGGRPECVYLEQSQEGEQAEFWSTLGSPSDVKSAQEGGCDDQTTAAATKLIKVSDASGKMETSVVASGTLERSQLDTQDVFIVDSSSELFVWIGRGATADEKKHGMQYATQYLAQENRPDWTPVTRVVERAETPMFQSYFKQWEAIRMPAPTGLSASRQPKAAAEDFDVSSLYAQKFAQDKRTVDDGSGKVTVWRIENFEKAAIPSSEYGQFWSGDSYIVLYKYQVRNRDMYIIYFWQGRDSTSDEKGASALLSVDIDDNMGGAPTQVRVVQGKEPNHFLSIFKGKMVVHKGGKASGYRNVSNDDSFHERKESRLYHVKGSNDDNTRAIELSPQAANLNSGDTFVVVTGKVVYVWYGNGSSSTERKFADSIANRLCGIKIVTPINEGHETAEFWEALGGKAEYATSSELTNEPREPRLFVGSNASGRFTIEEVFNFTQEDLHQDDIFLLDTFTELWVWVGHNSNKEERDMTFKAALDYNKKHVDGRDADTPVFRVEAGIEPPLFTAHFLGWDNDKASDFVDPYQKKLQQLQGAEEQQREQRRAQVQQITEKDIGFEPFTTVFKLKELREVASLPNNVDLTNREFYLSDSVFKHVLGYDKEAWKTVAAWKKTQLKKAKGLF